MAFTRFGHCNGFFRIIEKVLLQLLLRPNVHQPCIFGMTRGAHVRGVVVHFASTNPREEKQGCQFFAGWVFPLFHLLEVSPFGSFGFSCFTFSCFGFSCFGFSFDCLEIIVNCLELFLEIIVNYLELFLEII